MNQIIISHKLEKSRLHLYDQNEKPLSTFDLSQSKIPERLATELLKGIQLEFGHTSLETQRQAFRCVKKLALFLSEECTTINLPLPATTPLNFHKWLSKSSICGATAQSHQNTVLTILRWCKRNAPGVLSERTNIAAPTFYRNTPKKRKPLTDDSIRKILGACYQEIEEIEATKAFGDRLLAKKFDNADEQNLGDLINELLDAGGNKIPTLSIINRKKNNLSRRVKEAGGLDRIKGFIYTNPRSMFPFYLAILCQTAGNPTPIAHMSINCLEQHPIRSDIEIITWHKPRSNTEQRAEFPAGKKWSAPSIARKYIRASKHVRENIAFSYHKERLFLALPNRGASTARVPCTQLMHVMLGEFIKKHNLDDFDFKDIRTHSAQSHQKTKGGILAAKHKLNHRNSSTTQLYLNPTETSPQHDKYIHSFQGSIISFTKNADSSAKEQEKRKSDPRNKPFETVFGFNCSDPLSGISKSSTKGSLCLHFTGCATCPGAVVTVDDPVIVSRLISARISLKSAKDRAIKEGWISRFNQIYSATLSILENEIIPTVSKSVLEKAEALAITKSTPFLE